MNIPLSILDFSSYLAIIELQKKFSGYDERGSDDTYFRIVKADDDFEIIYKTIDNNNQEIYSTVCFYKDFVKGRIENLGADEIQKIEARINRDFLYNHHERKNFVNHSIESYKRKNRFIERAPFLNDQYRQLLLNQMNTILNFLYDDNILKDRFKESEKMKFNMNRNDIQILFHLLRQAKIIDHPHDGDLGRLIDNFFLYLDKENDTYKPIAKTNKDLSDYKNGNKTVESSLKRLKELLCNDGFYIIQP